MKKLILGAMFTVALSVFAVAQKGAGVNSITSDSAGNVRLGMTVAQARKAVAPLVLERSSDGEGVALIGVKRGRDTVMTLYAGEEDRDAKIDENAKIEQIWVWDKNYRTDRGVSPGMTLASAEKIYGKVKKITMSEIESREFAEFTNHPSGIEFRLLGKGGDAGVYPSGSNETTAYSSNAYIFSINVTRWKAANTVDEGAAPAGFSSSYTALDTGCTEHGGNEGGHVSHFCPGPAGYQIHYFDSATTLEFNAQNEDEEFNVRLASQGLDYDLSTRKVEWRLADGRPFAAIIRIDRTTGADPGQFLVVKGLKGFEFIDGQVNAQLAGANEAARTLADEAFRGKAEAEDDFQQMDVAELNKRLDGGRASDDPLGVISVLVGSFEDMLTRSVEVRADSVEAAEMLTVVVTDDGYADDSVRGAQYRFRLRKDAEGNWRVTAASRGWRCQPGRGSQEFSAKPCI
ncbi:MAG TPA: hypothetical protein PKD24_00705 [Pyrinomonadaceae bacterium]|nr:hypothetical protein [Pyrinomonadaceae bacterium]HMP64324.1 hypothetical protein [Pyrinomonadaceae bacterium]